LTFQLYGPHLDVIHKPTNTVTLVYGQRDAVLPPTRYSIGSGVNNSIRQLGSVIGIAFAVLCVDSESAHAATGFTALYSGLTAAAVITALLGAFVRTAPVQERSPSLAVVRNSVDTGLRADTVK
jgi:hypothetical protein